MFKSVWRPTVLTDGFVMLLTSGKQNDRIVPQLKPQPVPSRYLSMTDSLITLPFIAVKSQLLATLLYKRLINIFNTYVREHKLPIPLQMVVMLFLKFYYYIQAMIHFCWNKS